MLKDVAAVYLGRDVDVILAAPYIPVLTPAAMH